MMTRLRAVFPPRLALLLWLLGVSAALSAQPPAGERSTLDGVFSAAQAARGERTFRQTCTSCHSVDQLTGSRFREKWVNETVGGLFEFVTNAMPEGNPGSLRPEEYAGVIAFFLGQSGYPAGEQDLPAVQEELSKVRIVAPLQ